MARKPPPNTTDIDAYRRYIREALEDGLPVEIDAPTRARVIKSAGWQAALSLKREAAEKK